MNGPRLWVVLLFLVGTAGVLNARADKDRVPPSDPVRLMPEEIGGWTGKDLPIDDEVLTVLGKGDFLNRVYAPPSGSAANTPAIGLFIGYFPTQRTGQTIHSPQNCLPGAGWVFLSQRYTMLRGQNGKQYQVGEYVISNGESRQFVLYWYQSHGRSIANEYVSKAHMIADAIRYDRTDGALVRVISPISGAEDVDQARNRVNNFASRLAPMLPRFIPD